jgi:hypothetical protein
MLGLLLGDYIVPYLTWLLSPRLYLEIATGHVLQFGNLPSSFSHITSEVGPAALNNKINQQIGAYDLDKNCIVNTCDTGILTVSLLLEGYHAPQVPQFGMFLCIQAML